MVRPKFDGVPRTRRSFVKGMVLGSTAVAGGSSWWAATSRSRAARWFRTMVADARRPILPAPAKPQPSKWSDHDLTACWIGHSTVLINFHGVRILTDPALGSRVGVSLGLGTAGPKRYIAPALKLDELPPIDLVLLSHAHMDHMDLPTLSRLARQAHFVTASITGDVVAAAGAKKITELKWGERSRLRFGNLDLQLTALEVKHWGQRWPKQIERGYNGYALQREGRSILFGGDTAETALFKEHRAHGPYDLAIMPIGAYDPWIWNHCSPEQSVQMANWAGARHFLPVHHQTFRLSRESMDEPIERAEAALKREAGRLAVRRVGDTFVCPIS
jgi:L-ascorbate metabolism protein UlaG (beta-lactamase superfamily)